MRRRPRRLAHATDPPRVTRRSARGHGRCKQLKRDCTGRARERSSPQRPAAAPMADRRMCCWPRRAHPSKEALKQTGAGQLARPLLNASLAGYARWFVARHPAADGGASAGRNDPRLPAPSGRVQHPLDLQHAARRRHAAPLLQRYVEAMATTKTSTSSFMRSLRAGKGRASGALLSRRRCHAPRSRSARESPRSRPRRRPLS